MLAVGGVLWDAFVVGGEYVLVKASLSSRVDASLESFADKAGASTRTPKVWRSTAR